MDESESPSFEDSKLAVPDAFPPAATPEAQGAEHEGLEAMLRARITTWRPANAATNWPKLGDLARDERKGFSLALASGVVALDPTGRCLLPTLRVLGKRPTQPHALVLDAEGVIRVPWREFVTQVGAVAELVLDYGWNPGQVALDPDDWEFDIGVYEDVVGCSIGPLNRRCLRSNRSSMETRSTGLW